MSETLENAIEGKLSGDAFERLLNALHPDRERAGEMYVDLCLKLRTYFAWKCSCGSDVDDLVDETLNRVAKKLEEGVFVININAYSFGVAKKRCLEYTRKQIERPLEVDPPDTAITEPTEEADRRHECLKKCLAKFNPEDQELIVGYYKVEENEKIKDSRKRLAEQFGKSPGSLKVHVTRLREKLKKCINSCMDRESDVTKLDI